MALLELVHYPDPRLRVKSQPVTEITDEIRQLVEDMYETMYANNGVGLAANQVGNHYQIFVMDVSDKSDIRYCAINPEIIIKDGTKVYTEGCLSVEGAFDKVKRAQHVVLRAMDIDGKIYELDAVDLMAECIQHEVEHLNGTLFIDHLSKLKQSRIRKKIEKMQRRM